MKEEARRTILEFSIVRPVVDDTVDAMAERIGRALGCTLEERQDKHLVLFEGATLGMTIELTRWGGESGGLFYLRGYRPWVTLEDSVAIDISQAILDLLEGSGLGSWRVPTTEDMEAAARYNAGIED